MISFIVKFFKFIESILNIINSPKSNDRRKIFYIDERAHDIAIYYVIDNLYLYQ